MNDFLSQNWKVVVAAVGGLLAFYSSWPTQLYAISLRTQTLTGFNYKP